MNHSVLPSHVLRDLSHRFVIMVLSAMSASVLLMGQANAALPTTTAAANVSNASMNSLNNGVATTITAQLVSNNNGQEMLMPITAQTPLTRGNVIEYHVYLTNNNNDRIRTMQANVSIPNGTKLLDTLMPLPTMGSVDGQNFYPMPLRMQVGGQIQPIPLAQYRALQWQIEDVGLNQTATISYRVVVE